MAVAVALYALLTSTDLLCINTMSNLCSTQLYNYSEKYTDARFEVFFLPIYVSYFFKVPAQSTCGVAGG